MEVVGYIEPIEINLEMERSFLEYSMSVIVSRALPDVRDGLKPVHRRILYSMFDQGLRPDRPFAKCAKVVGEVMGTYHPHGDSAIYDALVRMVQDFSMRHPLVSGHGNFGGTGPDEGAAAMRYTECRLAPWRSNCSIPSTKRRSTSSRTTTTQLSSRRAAGAFPEPLGQRLPGHRRGYGDEDPAPQPGRSHRRDTAPAGEPGRDPDDLMKFVKGPDFPTGAQILGRQGILDAYRTGRGSIKMRAVAEIEETQPRHVRIVVTEFPYEVSVESIEEKIYDLVKNGDSTASRGAERLGRTQGAPRHTSEARRQRERHLNKLYKNTSLQTTFAVNMLALVDGVPRTLNFAQALGHYIAHQVDVVTRRTQFRLRKAEARAHIVEGLFKAIDMLDLVIAAIRGSDDRGAARIALMAAPFDFSEEQANHILDMTLGRLTRLGRTELEDEMAKLRETIAELQSILASDVKLRGVIANEMTVVRDKYANESLTQIVNDPGELGMEDLIDDEDIVITMTQAGYVKSVAADAFRTQGRGGRGVQGAKFATRTSSNRSCTRRRTPTLLLFSNLGRVFRLAGHEIPMKERTAKGTAIVNLLNLQPNESIQAIVTTDDFPKDKFLVFATANGTVKKTAFSEYDKSRREGWIAINLREGDEVVRVVATSGQTTTS
jgi:DNA gyrase subunit A